MDTMRTFKRHSDRSISIRGRPFRTEMRKNFFNLNSLPQKAEEANSFEVFKIELDSALGANRIEGYRGKSRNGVLILDDQP